MSKTESNQNRENPLKVQIISPQETLFESVCYMVVVPAVSGEIGFMANHEIVMTKLCEGEIKIFESDQKILKSIKVSEGYAKMQNDGRVLILIEQLAS